MGGLSWLAHLHFRRSCKDAGGDREELQRKPHDDCEADGLINQSFGRSAQNHVGLLCLGGAA
jgi:hypothetical protein